MDLIQNALEKLYLLTLSGWLFLISYNFFTLSSFGSASEDNMMYLLLSLLSVKTLLCNFRGNYWTYQLMFTFYVCIFLGPSSWFIPAALYASARKLFFSKDVHPKRLQYKGCGLTNKSFDTQLPDVQRFSNTVAALSLLIRKLSQKSARVYIKET